MRRLAVTFAALAVLCAAATRGEASPQQAPAAAPAPASAPVSAASTQEPAVIVMAVAGRVRARPSADAPWEPVKENDVLRAGTEIQTGIRSSAALRVGLNATVLLDAGTSVIIPTLDRDERILATSMAVRKGRADIRVDHVGLENDFKVVTPSTTIAVSGTSLAIVNGQLMGTEVTGSRTNLMAAIETQWIQRRLAFAFGHGTSSSRLPDPALDGIDRTVASRLMPGVVDDSSQLEQAWFDGSLQNVVFNINNVQHSLNAFPSAGLLDLERLALFDELTIAIALDQLIEIRAATAEQAAIGDSAALMAHIFAQQAVQLAEAAQACLPEIVETISKETSIAEGAAATAVLQRGMAESFASDAHTHLTSAVKALEDTAYALFKMENPELAQQYADAASLAASWAFAAAKGASNAAAAAFDAAGTAAQAAANAQLAIGQYYSKVAEIEGLAGSAAAQALIAQSAAETATALNELAKQIADGLQGSPSAATLLSQIAANTNQAVQASIEAAIARDEALAAASKARTMGEKVLFNHAAIFAAQAATAAVEAAEFAALAMIDAAEAQDAADLAQKMVEQWGGGKGPPH